MATSKVKIGAILLLGIVGTAYVVWKDARGPIVLDGRGSTFEAEELSAYPVYDPNTAEEYEKDLWRPIMLTEDKTTGLTKFVHTDWNVSLEYPSECDIWIDVMMGGLHIENEKCKFFIVYHPEVEYAGGVFTKDIIPENFEDLPNGIREELIQTEFKGQAAFTSIFYHENIAYKAKEIFVKSGKGMFQISQGLQYGNETYDETVNNAILESIHFLK